MVPSDKMRQRANMDVQEIPYKQKKKKKQKTFIVKHGQPLIGIAREAVESSCVEEQLWRTLL